MSEINSKRLERIYHDRLSIEESTDVAWFILREINKLLGLNLAKYLNDIDNPKVLDLCCGKGGVALGLKKYGLNNAKIFGLDIYDYKLPVENPYEEIIIGDITKDTTIEKIKEANSDGFHLITCFRPPPEIFEFIFNNLEKFTPLLKPGGYIICTNETSTNLVKKDTNIIKTDNTAAPIIAVYKNPEEKN